MADASLASAPPRRASERSALAPAISASMPGRCSIWSTTWLALKFQLGVRRPAGVDRLALPDRRAADVPGLPDRRRADPLSARACICASRRSASSSTRPTSSSSTMPGTTSCPACSPSSSRSPRITNIALAVLFLGEPLRPRVALGALLGLAGVALMFWHEIDGSALGLGAADRPRARPPRLPLLLDRQHDLRAHPARRHSGAFGQCLGRHLRRPRQLSRWRSSPAAPSSSSRRRAMS